MKFIKVFADDDGYKEYRDGENYEMPNVSLSRGTKKVYYNVDANGHEFVDLGLPSGTLWATSNVGAKDSTDYGLYFQWGDTSGYTEEQIGTGDGQKKFADVMSDYKWYNGGTFTKYTKPGGTLELDDDAARIYMGETWHIPTSNQIYEFINNTTSIWTAQDGVNGRLFTSKKDSSKSIFIPAAGNANNGLVNNSGDVGRVWSSTLSSGYVGGGLNLYFDSGSTNMGYGGLNRYNGLSVRGVIG